MKKMMQSNFFNGFMLTENNYFIAKSPIPSYVDMIIKQLNNFAPHSYIAKCKTCYLKKRKEEIDDKTALVLGHFAQNYSFVVEDEIQGYHWNNSQCTLHPGPCAHFILHSFR